MRCRGCQAILEFDEGAICKDCMIIAKERIRIKNNHPEQDAAMTKPTKEEMLHALELAYKRGFGYDFMEGRSEKRKTYLILRSLISCYGDGGPKVIREEGKAEGG